MKSKKQLRAGAIARRSELDMPALSRLLVTRLADLPDVRNARHLMLYLALPGEVDVEPLIEMLNCDGIERTFYVPRCAPLRRLVLHSYQPGKTPLVASAWGIREPDPDRVPEADPTLLDCVIVPALLATREGGRLGYGGGYYDRFLPHLRPDARFVAAVPSHLVVPHLPLDPWDVHLHRIVTEKGAQSDEAEGSLVA